MDVESDSSFESCVAGMKDFREKHTYNLLVAATGSVATLKVPILIKSILKTLPSYEHYKLEVRLVLTENAKHFILDIELLSEVNLYDDSLEWESWKKRDDPVMHVELGKWADMLLIAPLDANTLAKMAQGICDNVLTCTIRAWDMSKPLIFCPAMNTRMWEHPITAQQISTLKQWGYVEIPPISKKLMCGDIGMGAMAEIHTIVEKVRSYILQKDQEMSAEQTEES